MTVNTNFPETSSPFFIKVLSPVTLTVVHTNSEIGLGARVWEGFGPPESNSTISANVGDRYLDTSTGKLYELEPDD